MPSAIEVFAWKLRPRDGSAYDWILLRYPQEVAEQRRRVSAKNDNNAALVVHIDADQKTVNERQKQLEESLRNRGLTNREPSERIALAIPKRNIETWLHGLGGENVAVDEEYDFKQDSDAESPAIPGNARSYAKGG